MRVSCHVGLGETAELGSATSPRSSHPLTRAPLYAAQFDSTISETRFTLTTIMTRRAHIRRRVYLRVSSTVRFSHIPLHSPVQSDRSHTVVIVVGHKNWGGAQAALAAVTSSSLPQLEPVLQRWPTPLVERARRPLGSSPHPEILTRLIEESVSVQVNNVAKSEHVRKTWAGVWKRLWVHGLVCELKTKEAQA